MPGPATRRLLALLSIALAAFLVGCGGSDGGDPEPPPTSGTPEEQIRATVTAYLSAFSEGDGKAVCALMTPSARSELASSAAFIGIDSDKCEDVVPGIRERFPQEAEAVKDARIVSVDITGTNAVVRTEPDPDEDPTYLSKIGDRWFVAEDREENDETSQPVSEPPTLNIVEQGFTPQGDSATFGLVLENPTQTDATNIQVRIDALDADGELAETRQLTIDYLPAQSKLNVGGDVSIEGEGRIGDLEISATADSGSTPPGTPFPQPEAARVRFVEDGIGGREVKFELRNTTEDEISEIREIYVIFRDEDGKIIGGGSTFPDADTPPGGRTAVSFLLSAVPKDADKAEVSIDYGTPRDG